MQVIRGADRSRRRRPSRDCRDAARRLLLLVCIVTFAAGSLTQAWRDSPTIDEAIYVGAGLTSLTRHDLRINPQHPPLAKGLSAVPLLVARPVIPRGRAWVNADQHDLAALFVRDASARGQLRRDFFLARLVPIGETVAVGLGLAWLAEALFGGGGLLVLALGLLQPLVLGLGHVDGIDVPATLSVVALAASLLCVRRAPSTRGSVLAGV